MSKKLRSYRFDQRSLDTIERLKETLHLDNNSDVLRRAIGLLKMASDANERGGKLIILDDEGKEREIVLC